MSRDILRRLEAVARGDSFDPEAMRLVRDAGFSGRTIAQALAWARQNFDTGVTLANTKEKRP